MAASADADWLDSQPSTCNLYSSQLNSTTPTLPGCFRHVIGPPARLAAGLVRRAGRRDGLGHSRTIRPRNRRHDRRFAREPRAGVFALPAGGLVARRPGGGLRHDRDRHRRFDDLWPDHWSHAERSADRQLGRVALGHVGIGRSRARSGSASPACSSAWAWAAFAISSREILLLMAGHARALRGWLCGRSIPRMIPPTRSAADLFLRLLALATRRRSRTQAAPGSLGWSTFRAARRVGLGRLDSPRPPRAQPRALGHVGRNRLSHRPMSPIVPCLESGGFQDRHLGHARSGDELVELDGNHVRRRDGRVSRPRALAQPTAYRSNVGPG